MFIAVIHALYIFSLFKLHADSISAIIDIRVTFPDDRVFFIHIAQDLLIQKNLYLYMPLVF